MRRRLRYRSRHLLSGGSSKAAHCEVARPSDLGKRSGGAAARPSGCTLPLHPHYVAAKAQGRKSWQRRARKRLSEGKLGAQLRALLQVLRAVSGNSVVRLGCYLCKLPRNWRCRGRRHAHRTVGSLRGGCISLKAERLHFQIGGQCLAADELRDIFWCVELMHKVATVHRLSDVHAVQECRVQIPLFGQQAVSLSAHSCWWNFAPWHLLRCGAPIFAIFTEI